MHILHQLRTGGAEPTFDDSIDVMPWLEFSDHVLGVDLNAEHVANPRVFKSHMPYRDPKLPKGGQAKLLYCFRAPEDTIVSAYHFVASMLGMDKEKVSLDQFASMFLVAGSVDKGLNNLLDWWAVRNEPHVFITFYENLKSNHAFEVGKMADFLIGEAGDSESAIAERKALIETVTHQTSRGVMSLPEHKHRFDDHTVAKVLYGHRGHELFREALVGKVRTGGGKVGEGKAVLSEHILAAIQRVWNYHITSKLGFETPAAMRAAWLKEREEKKAPTV
jgi:hypothetical protein